MAEVTAGQLAERVAAGAALLDERAPGWRAKIDTAVLDLDSDERCILGQVFGGYVAGLESLGGCRAVPHGFCVEYPPDCAVVKQLTQAWREYLGADDV